MKKNPLANLVLPSQPSTSVNPVLYSLQFLAKKLKDVAVHKINPIQKFLCVRMRLWNRKRKLPTRSLRPKNQLIVGKTGGGIGEVMSQLQSSRETLNPIYLMISLELPQNGD